MYPFRQSHPPMSLGDNGHPAQHPHGAAATQSNNNNNQSLGQYISRQPPFLSCCANGNANSNIRTESNFGSYACVPTPAQFCHHPVQQTGNNTLHHQPPATICNPNSVSANLHHRQHHPLSLHASRACDLPYSVLTPKRNVLTESHACKTPFIVADQPSGHGPFASNHLQPRLKYSHDVTTPCNLLYRATPFGICCCLCGAPVGDNRPAMERHAKQKHHNQAKWCQATLLELRKKRDDLMREGDAAINRFLVSSVNGYVCECGETFESTKNIARHCTQKKQKCNQKSIQKLVLYRSVCGRLIDKTNIQHPVSNFDMSFDSTRALLSKHARDDESVECYIPLYHPIICSLTSSFDFHVDKMFAAWSTGPTESEQFLRAVTHSGNSWLCEYARVHVGTMPADIRASLLVFEGQEVGDVKYNLTFSFRKKTEPLVQELSKLLCCLVRMKSLHLSRLQEEWNNDSNVGSDPFCIPRLLVAVHLEHVGNCRQQPFVQQYCLARVFTKSQQQLKMRTCGDVGSMCSSVLFLLRAGACSCIYSLHGDVEENAKETVQRARTSRAAAVLAPMIRTMREMQDRKPKKTKSTIARDGSIAVDGFTVQRDVWSDMIPFACNRCCELLSGFFDGSEWKHVVNLSTPISVHQTVETNDFTFAILVRGRQISSNEITSKIDCSSGAPVSAADTVILHTVCSMVELAFCCFGGGAMRREEVKRLTSGDGKWHRNTACCESLCDKKGNHRCIVKRKTERKLPPSMARIYLLYKHASQLAEQQSPTVGTDDSNRIHTMQDAFAEALGLSNRMNLQQMRQFIAGMHNFLFPQRDNTSLCSVSSTSDVAAEKFLHTATTHALECNSTISRWRRRISQQAPRSHWRKQDPNCNQNNHQHPRPAIRHATSVWSGCKVHLSVTERSRGTFCCNGFHTTCLRRSAMWIREISLLDRTPDCWIHFEQGNKDASNCCSLCVPCWVSFLQCQEDSGGPVRNERADAYKIRCCSLSPRLFGFGWCLPS